LFIQKAFFSNFFQISKLLVVDDSKRLTVAGALNHEVFRAQRFSRSGCPTISSLDNRRLSLEMYDELDNRNNIDATDAFIGPNKSAPPNVPLVMLDNVDEEGKMLQLFTPVFDARQTFKISIMCVRFLIRLLYIKKTPELLCLKKAQVNPYGMRSYRKTIDTCAFTIYR
jgi:hypothetical protein